MNEDDDQAALAFQQECEARHYNEVLANDPGYLEWVTQLNLESEHDRFELDDLRPTRALELEVPNQRRCGRGRVSPHDQGLSYGDLEGRRLRGGQDGPPLH